MTRHGLRQKFLAITNIQIRIYVSIYGGDYSLNPEALKATGKARSERVRAQPARGLASDFAKLTATSAGQPWDCPLGRCSHCGLSETSRIERV